MSDEDKRPGLWRFLFGALRSWPYLRTSLPPVYGEEFTEEEFPIYCRKCKYLLRGLRRNRCPECGTIFYRGQLLSYYYGTLAGNIWLGLRANRTRIFVLIAVAALLVISGVTIEWQALGSRDAVRMAITAGAPMPPESFWGERSAGMLGASLRVAGSWAQIVAILFLPLANMYPQRKPVMAALKKARLARERRA